MTMCGVWRRRDVKLGREVHWSGLMSIYVDDLLVTAEDGAAEMGNPSHC